MKFKESLGKSEELSHILEEKQEEIMQITAELKEIEEIKEKLEETFQQKEGIFTRNQETNERLTIENQFLNKSLEEKEALMKNQYKEIEKLQKILANNMEKSEKLQNDLFISQKNFADFENSAKENAKLLKQSLEMITFENQSLNQRISQQQKESQEKLEEEKRNFSNLKKEIYVFELKFNEKEEKIQILTKNQEKNEENIKELENKHKAAVQALNKSEILINNKENEKNKAFAQIKQLKRRFFSIIREKFSDVRANMRRLKANCETIIEEYQGLIKQHLSQLPKEIHQFKRNQLILMEEHIEKLKNELESRYQRELSDIQEKNEGYEQELKKKFEGQFEEWNRKSMELTRKMEDIQNNSKKMQGEIYSLLKEKEAYCKEIELLKGELEKSLNMNQLVSKEKGELERNQDKIINEFREKIETKAKKNEKKLIGFLHRL